MCKLDSHIRLYRTYLQKKIQIFQLLIININILFIGVQLLIRKSFFMKVDNINV